MIGFYIFLPSESFKCNNFRNEIHTLFTFVLSLFKISFCVRSARKLNCN